MTKTNCKMTDEKLADVLLDPRAVPAKVQSHMAECGDCQAKLKELETTMQLLDGWEAPEPNAYFMTRLGAKMREEREAAPTGWLGRKWAGLRARMAYSGGLQARPLAAMAMTAVLLLGGGTYLGITDWMHTSQPDVAVVHDLQTLDNNSQVLDQMEALSDSGGGE